MNIQKKVTKKRLIWFLLLTFIITYAYEFLVLFPRWIQVRSIGALKIAPVMFIPGIVAILVRLITDEGFGNCLFLPEFKRGKRKYYLMAWFLPAVFTLIGITLYFLIFRNNYSGEMEFYTGVLAKQGLVTTDTAAIRKNVVSSAIAGVFLAPVLNVFTCFGEEWGWRAYLLPKLKELAGLKKALIISGIIWGLWHLPLTIMGHNYGLSYPFYPVAGIIAMCLFCIVIGILFSYLVIRTGSVFPAVIAHGALNGFASLGIYFTKNGGNPFIGPSVTGIVSGLPFIICAIFAMRALIKNGDEAKVLPPVRKNVVKEGNKSVKREAQRELKEGKKGS